VVGERREESGDIWMLDVARGTSSRFTFDPGSDVYPAFSPDGAQVAFASNRGGTYGLYVKPSSGVGAEQLILKVPDVNDVAAATWSPDSQVLLYSPNNPNGEWDIWALPLTGDRKPYPVLTQKYTEYRPRYSPDGRWMLYVSNETGRNEVYVQAFPPSGGKWQVSVNGANVGHWRKDGREIVFESLDRRVMAVDVKLGTTFEAGLPHELFQVPANVVGGRLAMSADGQRFLVPLPTSSDERVALRAVLNWPAGIKR
jgi:Tol biopolymer transport system component